MSTPTVAPDIEPLHDDIATAVLADHAAYVLLGGHTDKHASAREVLSPLAERIVAELKEQGYRLVCVDQ